MIKAVIFDFAGVIATDGYWVWLKQVVPDLENKRAYFAELADRVDKGLITNEQSTDALAQATGVPRNEIWPQVFAKIIINADLIEFIKRLKKNYKVGLLSNFNYVWLEYLLEKYGLTKYFDTVVISSRHHILKPEPAAFQKILANLHVKANESVFIDDRQTQVDGANKVGLKGLLYTTNEKLKRDMKNLGVKV